ncbi:proton channel OtopLc-like isoform X2 [Liolophura sinensis]|uniref:proton channel OtopLc-like isoform X2 n=1 Tax=Liolophura sinensis TaxID=3198878 RepID=UPI0031589D8A
MTNDAGGIPTTNGKPGVGSSRLMGDVDHKLVTVEEDDEDKYDKDDESETVKMELNPVERKDDPPSRRASVTWGAVVEASPPEPKPEPQPEGQEAGPDEEGDDAVSLVDSHHNSTQSDEEASPKTKQKKRRRPTLPKLFFPGLRKDSIAIYKASKLLQNSEDLKTPNGDSGFGPEDEEDDLSDDDHQEFPAITLPHTPVSPAPSILRRRSSKLRMEKPVKDSFFTVLSGLYAMLVVTLGGVLPIAEVFAHKDHAVYFELFYLYVYGLSIVFLIYVYVYLLGNRKIPFRPFLRREDSTSSQKKRLKKRKVSVDEVDSHTGSFYLRLGALAFGIGSMIHNGLQFGEYFDNVCESGVYAARPILHLMFTFVQLYFVFMNSKMCINRYKTIARFGLMHMVATNICVWLDTIVTETLHQIHSHAHSNETHQSHGGHAQPHDPGHHSHKNAPNIVMLNNTASSHENSLTAHVINEISTTMSTVINHTVLRISDPTKHHDTTAHVHHTEESHEGSSCEANSLMSSIVETAGPYLYPCTIEYSLICAGIVYTLWGNIGKRVMAYKPADGEEEEGTKLHRMSVDCSNSSRGLFLGIIVLVGTVITMVMFFVLIETRSHYESGILVESLTEIFLYLFSVVAVLLAAFRMRTLRFNSTRDTDFEEILILISLAGEFMFDLLCITAAWFEKNIYGSGLSIVAKVLGLLQSSVQTIFVLNGLRRCARTVEQERRKMGREFVTFLLISNISMWGVNTFALQRSVANPVQLHFYGALSWNILTHISIPLAIFFRFHSTVCLSNVWKRAWKGL